MAEFDVNSETSANNRENNSTNKRNTNNLTAEEKKLNHIRSEKKRRNMIRLGYEELTKVVPDLQDRVERKSKRRPGRIPLQAQQKEKESAEPEFAPGGPISELVILNSTVDYLRKLTSMRDELISRLHQLQTSHPLPSLVAPPSAESIVNSTVELEQPIWLSKWTGQGDIQE
ncbi:hypothetical protein E3Q22_01753 [Wallemia mellicola]|uniref:BHLH domain-containing protein n=2 Tax=Wallemia mellicola TaxID=1708541 RepID=A0A4T0PQ51_9BASI|nr:hypothetical protein WALSEDRAFT_67752 [Wallemia mellicola CBS 633.66]TIB72159.1 hypothetical protein E3Q24_01898 [Wallemia mellicola]EIM22862.1 hypothetical protein WALSEDRAFT_67752 [Wallemia mellicola CBS 633.66]TIB80696.1 hypothetical protein E3Q22_01753 [Wallemia mellicola]TIB85719.1 hypothetical protein E3Q21_01921 [Wallemia mellicola]TIB88875.1 hypothetical protein E3Q20_01914 [Wallemia mellicola]|eukprot:XP_006956911.1 hypothetical protein WALSEDRAFT_67752 [Wallemia mellicola CBS 633.66]